MTAVVATPAEVAVETRTNLFGIALLAENLSVPRSRSKALPALFQSEVAPFVPRFKKPPSTTMLTPLPVVVEKVPPMTVSPLPPMVQVRLAVAAEVMPLNVTFFPDATLLVVVTLREVVVPVKLFAPLNVRL